MGDLIAGNVGLPALFAADAHTAQRVLDFFTANIRNPHTRQAYARAVVSFAAWCEARDLRELRAVRPIHIATYIEALQAPSEPQQKPLAPPSVKQQLAALRMLFDWLVIGQIVPANPATSVRGPKHSVKKGKTPVLGADEARQLLDSIDTTTPVGLRDRADRVDDLYLRARRRCGQNAC